MRGVLDKSKTDKALPVSAKQVMSDPVLLLAFGLGSGLSPFGPGTAGTLIAVPLAFMLSGFEWWAKLMIVTVAFVMGVFVCDHATQKLGVHDHPGIVWDEIVGYLLAVILLPQNWWWLLLGFVVFRFFDIVKPWPIRELDHRIQGGIGIMLDDILAGVCTLICLALLSWGMAQM